MKNTLITKNDGFFPTLWKNDGFDTWLSDFFSAPLFNSLNAETYPTDEYWDSDGNLNIEIPLAGFKKEDISIFVENGYLVLNAKKQDSKKDVKYVSQGIRKKELIRKWYLNDTFVQDTVSSEFKDGILSIKIQAKEQEKPKKQLIEIK